MDFLTFFLYFTASALILEGFNFGLKYILMRRRRKQREEIERQLQEQFGGDGNIQMISMEDMVRKIKQAAEAAEGSSDDKEKKGKKTWH